MMDGPTPTLVGLRERRGRPDADDDADANEQNMRRHPLLHPPRPCSLSSVARPRCHSRSLFLEREDPPPLNPPPPEVSIVASRVLQKNEKTHQEPPVNFSARRVASNRQTEKQRDLSG